MRIIQVVTLVSPDGAYGGPVRVAVNQTKALLAAGHDVTLTAGARGFGRDLPDTFDGVPVKLFHARPLVPQLGFSGVAAPKLQAWLRRELTSADVMHVHMGRDLITLPSALSASRLDVPYVLQTHGMITPSAHPLASPVDFAWTKPALRRAARVFYLTEKERNSLNDLVPGQLRLQSLHNGVPDLTTVPGESSKDVEVLFLARLQERKRPLMFVEMAKNLHALFPKVRFTLVGPDEGQGQAVKDAITANLLQDVVTWEGPIRPEEAAERIRRCDIYVLPSINEPFPMSVLEAMSLAKPVVITDTCGLAETVAQSGAGAVVDASLASLTTAVRHLLADPIMRSDGGNKAHNVARNQFGMGRVVSQLASTYEEVKRQSEC